MKKGHQLCLTTSSHSESVLAVREYPVIVHVLQNIADNDVFQHLATEGSKRDRAIVGRIIALSFLEDHRDGGFLPVG